MKIGKIAIGLIAGILLGGVSINAILSGDTTGGIIVGVFALIFLGVAIDGMIE